MGKRKNIGTIRMEINGKGRILEQLDWKLMGKWKNIGTIKMEVNG